MELICVPAALIETNEEEESVTLSLKTGEDTIESLHCACPTGKMLPAIFHFAPGARSRVWKSRRISNSDKMPAQHLNKYLLEKSLLPVKSLPQASSNANKSKPFPCALNLAHQAVWWKVWE